MNISNVVNKSDLLIICNYHYIYWKTYMEYTNVKSSIELYNKSYKKYLNDSNDHKIFILKNNDVLIGSISISIYDFDKLVKTYSNNGIFITDLYIIEEFRSSGYGKYLLEYCLKYLINNNITDIYLAVSDEKLINFYTKYNFKIIDEIMYETNYKIMKYYK
jgi:ribosomal protein S18 acetylase RimI-like enzyme